MSSNILELFGHSTDIESNDWRQIIQQQYCPYLERKCLKVRKSEPSVSIGTCSVNHGVKQSRGVIICPHRFLERKQIFFDCIHLLTLHEPGNELHKIPEVPIPGGNVDYVLASVRNGKVVDFVGIELQALDTTGTLWPERQRFLHSVGIPTQQRDIESKSPYGINWKMTAKTILVQLHHKVQTFELVNRRLVLVLQDGLLDYMKTEFNFSQVEDAKLGNAMHFHAYSLRGPDEQIRLTLAARFSTTTDGIAACLGLQANPNIELDVILQTLQSKISSKTLLTI